MKDFLLKHKERYLYPRFEFAFGRDAEKLASELGISNLPPLFPNQGILIFQLPESLAPRWWKSTERVREGARKYGFGIAEKMDELSPRAIAWGEIYDRTVWSIRAMRDRWHEEDKLWFERLDPYKVHDPDRFYYVWQVTLPEEGQHQTRYGYEDFLQEGI